MGGITSKIRYENFLIGEKVIYKGLYTNDVAIEFIVTEVPPGGDTIVLSQIVGSVQLVVGYSEMDDIHLTDGKPIRDYIMEKMGLGGLTGGLTMTSTSSKFVPYHHQVNPNWGNIVIGYDTATSSSSNSDKYKEFKKDAEVVLISGHGKKEGDMFNPVWNKNFKHPTGKVIKRENEYVTIKWDNGNENRYDLDRYGMDDSENGFVIKLLKDAPEKKVRVIDFAHLDKLVLDENIKKEIVSVIKQMEHGDKLFTEWGLGTVIEYGKGMTFLFHGLPGTGKTWAANLIARAIGSEILTLGPAQIQSQEPGAANRAIEDAFKAAAAGDKVLLIDECDSLIFNREQLGMILSSEVNTLLTQIEKFEGVCILATNRINEMDPALERRLALIVEFMMPTKKERHDIWKNLLPKQMPLDEDVVLDDLSEHVMTGGFIKNAVLQAARTAVSEGAEAVSKQHFDRAIARVKKSNGLMGVQKNPRARMDYSNSTVGVGMEKSRTTSMDTFLSADKESSI